LGLPAQGNQRTLRSRILKRVANSPSRPSRPRRDRQAVRRAGLRSDAERVDEVDSAEETEEQAATAEEDSVSGDGKDSSESDDDLSEVQSDDERVSEEEGVEFGFERRPTSIQEWIKSAMAATSTRERGADAAANREFSKLAKSAKETVSLTLINADARDRRKYKVLAEAARLVFVARSAKRARTSQLALDRALTTLTREMAYMQLLSTTDQLTASVFDQRGGNIVADIYGAEMRESVKQAKRIATIRGKPQAPRPVSSTPQPSGGSFHAKRRQRVHAMRRPAARSEAQATGPIRCLNCGQTGHVAAGCRT